MEKFKLLLMVLWLGALLSAFPANALADELETIAEDLHPASGYLVMPIEEEFLVDLDASKGLRVGDLLSVVVPGEKIVHPVTNEVIGSLDSVKAVLKVTRVKSGYSYARRISGAEAITKGERVRRFAGLTAALYAPQQQDERFYDRLRELLPELEWQGRFRTRDGGNDSAMDLSFVLEGGELRLLDGQGEQLRAYAVATSGGGRPAAPTMVQPIPGVPLPGSAPAPAPGPGTAAVFPAATTGVDFGSRETLAEFPDRVLMAGFVRDRERLLVATVDGSWVRVFEVAKGMQQIAATRVRDGAASPLAINWWRPDQTGPLYLAVTAAVEIDRNYGNTRETRMGGAIYAWDGKTLTPVVEKVSYFLETYDRNGDGRPETLLGQEFDLDQVYGRVFALTLENGQLQSSEPAFELPWRFALPGSAMGDLDGDGQAELITVYNGELAIFSGNREVYRNSGKMGGSLATLTYDVNPGMVDTLFETVSLEVPPLVRDIDGDGVAELLAIASDTSSVKAPGIGPGIESSWIAVFKYQNAKYDKGRLQIEREYPLQGLWEEAGQVFLVESTTSSAMSREGTSNLLVYSLAPGTARPAAGH